ncbi:antibiotic biosynthesis monooxygenase family protein [Microbacterium sp.]|uniref:antibiotic biosynthesis monooxygenase family protein n=1 Tax=Microbacterium sp. TaxID=51671 RepID=UPI002D79EF96|nr:antibiotic biosynthesis monooxygenase family protein [Microbacterium sp.]HET6300974.1 antibiotic biosynthesis monooxygenase family protein [Microbacterium sp.]
MTTLTFIASYRVHDGDLDAVRSLAAEYADLVERDEPRCISLRLHFTEDGSRFVHLAEMRDSDAMESHLALVAPFIEGSADDLVAEQLIVIGEPGPRLQGALERNAAGGTTIAVFERPGFGFDRIPALAG